VKLKTRGLCITAWCGVFVAFMTAALSSVSESRQPASSRQLLDQFQNTPGFWKQLEIAQRIVALHDPSVLPQLVGWLNREDRHLRGNAAFIFASLGDERGFDVIRSILNDRSWRQKDRGLDSSSGSTDPHTMQNRRLRQIGTTRLAFSAISRTPELSQY
jgi:hypothetical protein